MTKESCIVEQLFIDRIGKKVYFQIPLPRDASKIIGLEFGAGGSCGTLLNPGALPPTTTVVPNKAIGKISLQVAGKENIFFQQTVVEDRNTGSGEFFPGSLPLQPWTLGRKREEWPVEVEKGTLIEGLFQDSWGEGEFAWLQYSFSIYVWVEKQES